MTVGDLPSTHGEGSLELKENLFYLELSSKRMV